MSDIPLKKKQHPDSHFEYQPLNIHELVTPEIKEKHRQKKKVNIAPKLRKSMIEPLLLNPISMDDLKLNNSRVDTVLKNRATLFKAVKLAIRAIPRGKRAFDGLVGEKVTKKMFSDAQLYDNEIRTYLR